MRCSYLALLIIVEVWQTALTKIRAVGDGGIISGLASAVAEKEPSCEELRKLWRHTKREMQQQKTDSEATTARFRGRLQQQEAVAYGWKAPAQARPRNAAMYAKPVYGRIVHSPDNFIYRSSMPNRIRSYDQVARMVGGSSIYYNQHVANPRATYFRLEYPSNRRPAMAAAAAAPSARLVPVGRFQELQSALRSERANDLQQGLKDQTRIGYREENNNRFSTYPFPQSDNDDASASSVNERKLRGTNEAENDSIFASSSEQRPEVANSEPSTNKPVVTEDDIPRRWALGEWKR